mgnify:CR=1 FL=1
MDWAGCFSPIPFFFEINLKKDMKNFIINDIFNNK